MIKPIATVDFSKPIRAWDGFGVTYVEEAQYRTLADGQQEYGGLSVLSEEKRQEVIDLIFGDDGLKPALSKMFLDAFHQQEPGPDYNYDPLALDMDTYDHASTTQWMRHFVREGLAKTRARGDDLQIIATLFGPPGWMTTQKFVRGRDIDPALKTEVAKYLLSWAKWLREHEEFPVKYVSLHNEGEDWYRWPLDGSDSGTPNHDHNLFFSPETVVEFINMMPDMIKAFDMNDVGIAPGETSNWYRFHSWGYADAIADDPDAAKNLGLISSHGFFGGDVQNPFFGDWRSAGIDIIREQRPDLHAWVTSTSWKNMDVYFVNEIRNSVYSAKVNGLIPWAIIQKKDGWIGGDPNPGCAIQVYADEARFEVRSGYYYFKQVSRAGQAGMSVCKVALNDRKAGLMAFGSNDTKHPDAIVLVNMWDQAVEYDIRVNGSKHKRFEAYQTSPDHNYAASGVCEVEDGALQYTAAPLSVTTFFGV